MSDCSEIKNDRRRFIKGIGGVGVALLTVWWLPSIARSSGSSASDGDESDKNLIIHSGPGFVPHTHDLLIPYAVLSAPPIQGIKLQSTSALFHAHDVVLSEKQLIAVNHGRTITAFGGSHTFVIALAHGTSDRASTLPEVKRRA